MDPVKHGISIKCSHLLDDQNYGDWKVQMSISIKSLGMEVWKSMVTSWSIPTKTEKGRTGIKLGPEWNSEKRKAATSNYTALHAIQCSMNDRKTRLIASLKYAKEVWDIL